jgi:hypothetical protein
MADERVRRQLALLAAQMTYHRAETEYFTAKRKAAKQLGVEYRNRPGDLPSNKEIRDQIQAIARIHEGPGRVEALREMRLDALRLMRRLARFRRRVPLVSRHVHRHVDGSPRLPTPAQEHGAGRG